MRNDPSPFMLRTLQVMAANGGEAYPEKGGWWRSQPSGGGIRLTVTPEEGSVQDSVTVVTLRALAKRGLVEKIANPDRRTAYHPGFRLTEAGRSRQAQC